MGGRIVCLLLSSVLVVLGLVGAEESDSVQMRVRFDGQVCTAELNKCPGKNDENLAHDIGRGIQGEKGQKGERGYPGPIGPFGRPGLLGQKGNKGDSGICADSCLPPSEVGSREHPAPAICKFRTTSSPENLVSNLDSFWVMKAQPFKVACEKISNATCLILNERNMMAEWPVEEGDNWASKHGYGVPNFFEVSESQLRFLKEQSEMVTQTIRIYLVETVSFDHIELKMLSWNDGIISKNSSASTPLQYEILEKDVPRKDLSAEDVGLPKFSWHHTELKITGSARNLPVVDFFVRFPSSALSSSLSTKSIISIKIKATELCFN